MPLRKFRPPLVNTYLTPQKLNKCKYELIIYDRLRESVITESVNREVVLVDFIKNAFRIKEHLLIITHMKFKIVLTEDGVKSVLIDSAIDKNFINFLYDPFKETGIVLQDDLEV